MNIALQLSLAAIGLDAVSSPRDVLSHAAKAGFRAVQLNAAAAGFRARQLDGSGRRDLAASLSRSGLRLSGLDLWIVPEHFAQPAHQDRAIAAVTDAIGLLRDLLTLGAAEPGAALSLAVGATCPAAADLAHAAERQGIHLADHTLEPHPTMGVGLDPAMVLMAGRDATAAVHTHHDRIVAARLSDAATLGRCELGKGRLDLLGYAVALSTIGYKQWLTLDVRSLLDPMNAATRARELWDRTTALPGT
jgi:sugar phosphate isomerase/epimerase